MNRAGKWLRVRRNFVALWTCVFGAYMTWMISELSRLHKHPLNDAVTWGIAVTAGLAVGFLAGQWMYRVHWEFLDRFRREHRR